MSNFENGASLDNENVAGNVLDQCLGALNMNTSCPDMLNTSKGSGQPMLDDSGQIIGGWLNGHNGKDSRNNVVCTNNEQSGIGSVSGNSNGVIASIPQHANARVPKITATNGRDFCSKFKGKQSFASLFKDNRAPSDESKQHFVAPSPLGEFEIVSEDVDSVEKSFGFVWLGMLWVHDRVHM